MVLKLRKMDIDASSVRRRPRLVKRIIVLAGLKNYATNASGVEKMWKTGGSPVDSREQK